MQIHLDGKVADTPRSVLSRFLRNFDISGRTVLELGGCCDDDATGAASVWWSVDPRNVTGERGNIRMVCGFAEHLPEEIQNIDFVFACNSFQHIGNLRAAYHSCFKVMKEGGIIYAAFGPIWTAPDGAHIENVIVAGKRYDFWRGMLLPPWYHLIANKTEIDRASRQIHGDEVGSALANFVVDSTWINRVNLREHLKYPLEAGLTAVSIRGTTKFGYRYQPHRNSRHMGLLSETDSLLKRAQSHLGYSEVEMQVRDLELILQKPARRET